MLFPWMSDVDPSKRPLVARLPDEHQRIRDLLTRTAQELTDESRSVQDTADAFVTELWAHNAREEGEVYAGLDRNLPPDRWNAVEERLKSSDDR